MAGVATKAKRKRPTTFTPSRASRIEVVEDTPATEERIAVPLGQDADHSIVVSVPPVNGRLSHGPARRIEPPAAAAEQLGKLVSIPVDEIRPNPFQPRQEWDQAELEELAASIKVHGIRQPLDVRLVDDDYELVAGERRLRAAKLAGLAEVPAILKVTTDKESREIALIENLQRKDLSDIELARAFKLIMQEDGYTAEQLAEKLHGPDGAKRTRSYVANLVRLLELPEEWQQRVVSQEMPSTHARYLLPYKDAPAVLKAVEKDVKERGLPSLKTWEENLSRIVRATAAPLSRHVHNANYEHSGELRIDPKHPQYQELQVVEVKTYYGKQKLALNAPLARKLLSEKAKAWHERHPSAKAGGKDKSRAELAAAAKKERERLQADVRKIVARWVLAAIVERATRELPRTACDRLLLYFVASNDGDSMNGVQDFLAKRFNLKVTWETKEQRIAECLLCGNAPKEDLVQAVLVHVFREWADHLARQQWSRVNRVELAAIVAITQMLDTDPAREWATVENGFQVMLGPLTDDWLEVHSEPQLRALCDEWDLEPPAGASAEHLRNFLRRPELNPRPVPVPTELQELLGGKTTKAAKRPRKAK